MDAIVEAAGGTRGELVERVVQIVIAYVAHNRLPASELPMLIGQTYEALCGYDQQPSSSVAVGRQLTPDQVRGSITRDTLISFEDGRPYKTLKRHLTSFGLTPDTYRAKWNLPSDYPMVAPSYSEKRAALARGLGLGEYDRTTRRPISATETGGHEPALKNEEADAT